MIFVVGTGRCGTSTVARLLHTRCGVNMGTNLAKRSKIGQTYEDQDFSTLHAAALAGKLSIEEFCHRVLDLTDQRTEPWGMKCPATADFIYLYREWFPEARYVWCQRDPASALLSIQRVRPKMGEMERILLVYRRIALLKSWLPKHEWWRFQIDFNWQWDEGHLTRVLNEWIGEVR